MHKHTVALRVVVHVHEQHERGSEAMAWAKNAVECALHIPVVKVEPVDFECYLSDDCYGDGERRFTFDELQEKIPPELWKTVYQALVV